MYISYVIVPVSYQKHIYLEFNQVFIRNQPQPSLQNFRSGKAEEPLLYTHKHTRTHTHNINSIDPFQTESKSGSINRADKPPSFLPRQPFPSILLSSPPPPPPRKIRGWNSSSTRADKFDRINVPKEARWPLTTTRLAPLRRTIQGQAG